MQKLEILNHGPIVDDEHTTSVATLAKNDGLILNDFKEWFKKPNPKPMAIIHFSDFRYRTFPQIESTDKFKQSDEKVCFEQNSYAIDLDEEDVCDCLAGEDCKLKTNMKSS